jgi:hypothetical protein
MSNRKLSNVATSALSGPSGYSGTSGISGFSGQNGVIGVDGASGYSGYSGYSGTSGAAGPSTTINATDDTSTTTLYPVMVGAAGSGQTAKATTTKLTFNANTGVLSSSVLSSKLQAYTETVTTVGTITANTNIDTSLSNIFDVTLGGSPLTLTFTNPPSSGTSKPVTIVLRQDGSGNRLATFANSYYTDGIKPVLSTNANAIDVLTFFTVDGGIKWLGTFAMANVS